MNLLKTRIQGARVGFFALLFAGCAVLPSGAARAQSGVINVRKPSPAVSLSTSTAVKQRPIFATRATTSTTARRGAPAARISSEPTSGTAALSATEIAQLGKDGVPADYVAAAIGSGYALNVSEITRLYHAGVKPEFITQVAKARYDLNPGEMIRLHAAGVGADEMVKIKQAGGDFNPGELIQMHQAGVPAEFIAGLYAGHAGASYSAKEIIDLHQKNGKH